MKNRVHARFKLSLGLAVVAVAVAVVFGIAATVSQAQRGPDDLKAPEGDPGLDVLACYAITTNITSQPPLAARMVTDNYGGDVVNIFGSQSPFFCESAVKTSATDTATLPYGKLGGHVFQCFDLSRGADPDDDLSLVTHNFGTEEVTVGKATQMCESARKTAPDGDEMGWPGRMALHCFGAEGDSDHGSPDSSADFSLTTDNFGSARVNLLATVFMCEEASKHDADPTTRDVGRPTGRVWQCIEAEEVERDPSPLNPSISLMTSNFGKVEVGVGDLVLMCERARKVYSIQAFPVDRP